MSNGREWTTKEVRLLKEHWNTVSSVGRMQELLPDRSISSIYTKVKRLGLSGTKGLRKTHRCYSYIPLLMWSEINKKPHTTRSMGEVLGIARPTVQRYLGLFKEAKVVHISQWRKPATSTQWVPLYAVGDLPNAKKPKPSGCTIRDHEKLGKYKGNPFGDLLRLSNEHPEPSQDVCP